VPKKRSKVNGKARMVTRKVEEVKREARKTEGEAK
jgi:hypothetical protein